MLGGDAGAGGAKGGSRGGGGSMRLPVDSRDATRFLEAYRLRVPRPARDVVQSRAEIAPRMHRAGPPRAQSGRAEDGPSMALK
jgi:hypothetical protein